MALFYYLILIIYDNSISRVNAAILLHITIFDLGLYYEKPPPHNPAVYRCLQ